MWAIGTVQIQRISLTHILVCFLCFFCALFQKCGRWVQFKLCASGVGMTTHSRVFLCVLCVLVRVFSSAKGIIGHQCKGYHG
jgi:hypothetical protein